MLPKRLMRVLEIIIWMYMMMKIILQFHKHAEGLTSAGKTLDDIMKLDVVTQISRMKHLDDKEFRKMFDDSMKEMRAGV